MRILPQGLQMDLCAQNAGLSSAFPVKQMQCVTISTETSPSRLIASTVIRTYINAYERSYTGAAGAACSAALYCIKWMVLASKLQVG